MRIKELEEKMIRIRIRKMGFAQRNIGERLFKRTNSLLL